MVGRVLLRRVAPALAVFTASAATLAAAVPSRTHGPALLPDLEQEVPAQLEVTMAGGSRRPVYRLGFRSAVRNVGRGPLSITGRRASARHEQMVADQVIDHDDAPRSVKRAVGRLRYVISPDHRHWHLLGFERYELRQVGGRAAVASDRKTGFCLGDRYAVRDLPAAPAVPVWTGRCGLAQPGRLQIDEGISVGYGDDYDPTLEGQYVRLTGLPAGRYLLVHRVNADRSLREARYDNNSAALLIRLRWKRGRPTVRALESRQVSATL
jgi:Lysyl oxidase